MSERFEFIKELKGGDKIRLLRIMRGVSEAPTIRVLRSQSRMRYSRFGELLKLMIKEGLMREIPSKTKKEKACRKPVLTERGEKTINFLEVNLSTAKVLERKIVFKIDGGAHGTINLTLGKNATVEPWTIIQGLATGTSDFWRILAIVAPSWKMEGHLSINDTIRSLEGQMWRFIGDATGASSQIHEYGYFRLPDWLGLPSALEELKAKYTNYWSERHNEIEWVPHDVREALNDEKVWTWFKTRLELDRDFFMPSSIWHKLDLGFKVPPVWSGNVSLPFNVVVEKPRVYEIAIKVRYTLWNAAIANFGRRPLDLVGSPVDLPPSFEKGYVHIIGSPAPLISMLKKHQSDPTFYAALTMLLEFYKSWEEEEKFKPICSAHQRYRSTGRLVNIARAYIDVWKGKVDFRQAELEISKGKRDL